MSAHLDPSQVINSLHADLIGDNPTDDDIAVLVVENTAEASARTEDDSPDI